MINKILAKIKKVFNYLRNKLFRKTEKVNASPKTKKLIKWDDQDNWTLKEFLMSLDNSFAWLKADYWKTSWMDGYDIKAFKNISPYVVTKKEAIEGDRYMYAGFGYPTFNAIAFNFSNTDEKFNIKGGFAYRLEKLPWHCEKLKGTPYFIGACYYCNKNKTSKQYKTWWVSFYIVIGQNGKIQLPKMHKNNLVNVKPKHKNKIIGSYNYKIFHEQPMISMLRDDGSYEEGELERFSTFILNSAIERDFNWSILVKKNQYSATYTIPNDKIKYFFKDRLKLRTTPTGRRKPILHYVKSHQRKNGSNIKTHIRGQRKFYWKNYFCSIFAPGFHGKGITEFQIGGEECHTKEQKKISYSSKKATRKLIEYIYQVE